jgi:CBS domain-containing protein
LSFCIYFRKQTPNPITLKTTDKVDEAIGVLLTGGFNGAPVVDPVTNNLVGCVSAFDFIQKEETGAVLPFDIEDPEEQQRMMIAARKIVATTVGELMTDSALTVTMGTSMRDAAELLTREKKHRLCVIDDNNNLVGILSSSDVMRNIVDVLRALPETSSAVPIEEKVISE